MHEAVVADSGAAVMSEPQIKGAQLPLALVVPGATVNVLKVRGKGDHYRIAPFRSGIRRVVGRVMSGQARVFDIVRIPGMRGGWSSRAKGRRGLPSESEER